MAQGKSVKKPPALKKGDTIGIMAPSSRVDRDVVAKAVAKFEDLGFRVHVHPQTFARHGQSAGTGQQKAMALHDLYKDSRIKAIFTACGGNGAGTMLEHLDFKLIARNPKILIGYSDVSALLNAIYEKSGTTTFHGPMLRKLSGDLKPAQLKQCFNLLGGRNADVKLSGSRVIRAGKAEGPLVGGNLSLVCSLLGTPWQPDFRGKILFLEDCADEASRIDRMLLQLRNAGVFAQVKGVVLGGFTDITDNGHRPYRKTVTQMIRECTEGFDIPVIVNAPFGHGRDLYTLPLGIPARLNATARKPGTLRLDGPAVSL